MEVRNCPRCGKVFVYTGLNLCPACRREEEELFERVEAFLRSHPGANLEEIAEGTGIAKEIILDFIRSGRLVTTMKAEGLLRCGICGRPIDQGRICKECAGRLKQGLVKEKPSQALPERREVAAWKEHRLHIADLLKERRGGERHRSDKK